MTNYLKYGVVSPQIWGSFTATKPLNYCIGTFLVEKTLVIVDDDNFSFAYIFFLFQ